VYKTYCDECGSEIRRNYSSDRLKPVFGKWKLEVMVYHDGMSNAGDICEECLINVFCHGKEKKPKG